MDHVKSTGQKDGSSLLFTEAFQVLSEDNLI
jgi:hypothetical protein